MGSLTNCQDYQLTQIEDNSFYGWYQVCPILWKTMNLHIFRYIIWYIAFKLNHHISAETSVLSFDSCSVMTGTMDMLAMGIQSLILFTSSTLSLLSYPRPVP